MNLPGTPSGAARGPEFTDGRQHIDVPVPAADMQSPVDAWSVIDRFQKEHAEQHRRDLEAVTQRHLRYLTMSVQMMAEIVGRQGGHRDTVVAARAQSRIPATCLQWRVSTETLPVLADHQVRGRIVVPMVIVLDAMLRAARVPFADERSVVRDFQVLSGVTFPACEQRLLTIDFDPVVSPFTMTVRDHEGRKRYRAVVDNDPVPSPSIVVPVISGAPWPISLDDAYTGPLFHGPRFAAIQQLGSFSFAGGTATLKCRADLGWPEDDWAIDAASVDGGLQLGLLWTAAHGRSLMLPQRIGRVVLDQPFPKNAVLRCRIAANPVNDSHVDFDVTFETADGAHVATLEAVEFYAAGPAADASA